MASYNVCSWGKVNCLGSKLKPIGRLAAFFLRTDNVSFSFGYGRKSSREARYLGPSSVMAFQDLGTKIIHIHQGIVSYGDNPFP